MPKFEPKQIQKELEQGRVWPVYWLYGSEAMKSRELLKRIRAATIGENGTSFNETWLEGTEVSSHEVLDAAQSLALGGSLKLVIVKDAHALKDAEALAPLFGPAAAKETFSSVCVLLSKDLDQRKKFSKLLVEKAAVVPCEEIAEGEREAWVLYLAKKQGIELLAEELAVLRAMDPWSLDLTERELDKLVEARAAGVDPLEVLTAGVAGSGSDEFLEGFFTRDLKVAFGVVEAVSDSPETSLPLLGLIGWNVRALMGLVKDRELGTRDTKLNPYLADRLNRWASRWSAADITELQHKLCEVDFGMKQTQRIPLGLWSDLVLSFCR